MYTLHYDDVERSLVDRIDPEVTEGAVIFYAARRHFLEILPEGITSFWLLLTVLAVLVNVDVLSYCDDERCRTLAAMGMGLAMGLAFLNPLGLELFRWRRDIYYLTQWNWSHWYFSLKSMDYLNESMGFVTSTRVQRPTLYRMFGLDVGSLLAVGVEETRRFTPLLPNPYTLQRRIREAQAYKPAAPSIGSRKLWRE